MHSNPVTQFILWQNSINVPDKTAAILSTCTKAGIPSARTVLIKDVNDDGFTFYTNVNSNKGKNLRENPKAAMVFYWDSKQVTVRGDVYLAEKEKADAYFNLRPRRSKAITALSKQSQELKDEDLFLKEIQELEDSTNEIERPEHWEGFRLKPDSMEFFIADKYRLNKRFLYTLQPDETWKISRLYP
ncbi:pyridoxamine 5'-phosphate oxidase [Neorickettsia helminthoeca str. Oregon]|uniref:Pyridoxamine 5'-phosphate oxidase n=1 Tax=Neorickettsia helminthoeca str. Oregon TaxID=1286528 RepID=X5GW54_9RICK|nr:pyridoxal 5'-phosphate synthase [Neorickettsia helminthoeca]AHX11307.1 pyridoxamine 5'-phosphate oxidase [Neorickettsia helminthoeca str. Oregon]